LAACDRLIADGSDSQALQIWNGLATLHEIPYGALHPDAGQSLTDGDFKMLPTSRAFAWRSPTTDGIAAFLAEHRADAVGGIRIGFSGRQPENCEVLAQYLPVMENSKYEMRFRYRTSGISPEAGLAWRVTDFQGAVTLAHGEDLASDNEKEDRLTFRTSTGNRLVRLALVYRRALGTTRIDGSITLRKVEVFPSPAHQE
jgi:hypothetical protein